ncbi:hypothetical protein CTAYLR_008061 [Chrysophaeum taylorii]|uniref:Gfo/Idh/MocA-like oxidoreductase N-terminal domain-containing protein n=1 Tax=Chrysophaeum taylorii TaxID=2483200 RepID=A0AAD7ULD5_9STRA|nr:hypothetical protein CTAYLR_008061 [Chrysophaeum taylorii]
MEEVVRVGIMGSAAIAKKNAVALQRSSSCRLVAIASRNESKAKAWCEELGVTLRVVDYEGMVADPEVDAVYVPLPTMLHLEWVLKLAAAKKHVLVEKPVGVTTADVEKMIAACREHGVAIMDGTMFMHHARFALMSRLFDDVLHWKCTRVTSAFSFYGGDDFLAKGNVRTRADADPLGALGDLGWYCARITLAAFRYEAPVSVVARLRDESDDGVPFELDVDVEFSGDRRATFHASFKHDFRQWFEAFSRNDYGAARVVRCSDFVIPRREETTEFEIEELPSPPTVQHDTILLTSKTVVPVGPCSQERDMWDAFASLCRGDLERRAFFEKATLLTTQILSAAITSIQNGGASTPVV